MRREIVVEGIVQGVGFRPFVHGLATRLQLGGGVRNTPRGVSIDVEGDAAAIAELERCLRERPPAHARIERITARDLAERGERSFRVAPSAGRDVRATASGVRALIPPDLPLCEACRTELFDRRDRRFRYPFISCTDCGPRYTVALGAPYDRCRTELAVFEPCSRCAAEQANPADRRFHAQTIACPDCGPTLRWGSLRGDAALRAATATLRDGGVVAIRGVGGFHLACEARDAVAVGRVRQIKRRPEKPLALLVRDPGRARELCRIDRTDAALLQQSCRPIVLLARRDAFRPAVCDAVAPHAPQLGLMLPGSGLQELLLEELGDRPLVLTSANRSGDPLAVRTDDLAEIAAEVDGVLAHDLEIAHPIDDPVVAGARAGATPLRRGRGQVPGPIALPHALEQPALALGAQLKAAFALGCGDIALLSQPIGDLDSYAVHARFSALCERALAERGVQPELIVCDAHPDYGSTALARQLAEASGARRIAVQHHHAHLAAALVDAGASADATAIGVCFDGTGFGPDGTIWGGEFLVGGCADIVRRARLRPVALPGGDAAIRQPWRAAFAQLHASAIEPPAGLARRWGGARALARLARAIERGVNAPRSSSAGRLFDAVASLVAGIDRASYDGQPAIRLTWLAQGVADLDAEAAPAYPFEIAPGVDGRGEQLLEIDVRPLIAGVVGSLRANVRQEIIALRFHRTVAEMIVATCRRIRDGPPAVGSSGARPAAPNTVALAGGCMCNPLVVAEARGGLEAHGFTVLTHRRVPPDDGAIALGQLAVAAARDKGASCA